MPAPSNDRDIAILAIRTALKERTGQTWSVTGGRGTGWGWISIQAPPARRTAHWTTVGGETFLIDTGERGGRMTEKDAHVLADALALDRVPHDGVSIPASSAYRDEYVARAQGRTPDTYGTQYWD